MTALVICLGPILIGVGTHLVDVDEELAQTGAQVAGTVVKFDDDVTKASARRMKVEFQAWDGSDHATWAAVDHDQHPAVGDEVTVAYREQDAGQAIVLGFESDGVWLRGVGVVLTVIFGGLGLIFVIAFLRGYFRKGPKGT
ncbi:DUF3592 domain-containing protein [Arthrobacter sp. ISL-72]|nr:DUF3592 domain-containing protein [Arthrobacter sp. ISL-72]